MAKTEKVLKVTNGGCFDDLYIIDDEETTQKNERPLDMVRELLPALDRKEYNFYSTLSETQKKSYSPLVVMRWMGSSYSDGDYVHHKLLLDVNDVVNLDFWVLGKHPELQHKLLSLCGLGYKTSHQWIPMIKKHKARTKCMELLEPYFPTLNNQELKLLMDSLSFEEFKEFFESYGIQDGEIKKITKIWKDEHKGVK